VKYKPTPLSKCYGIFGIDRIEFIPPDILYSHNPDGLYKSFADGWRMAWGAIMKLLQRGIVPTKSRVEDAIDQLCHNRYDDFDYRKWQHFLSKGGKVEYALDAILVQTKNVCVHGDDGWEYGMFEDDFNALDATPFDLAFDLARVKCLELTDENMREQPMGPYRANFRDNEECDDEDFDESDY
jgi:hypothetical protein